MTGSNLQFIKLILAQVPSQMCLGQRRVRKDTESELVGDTSKGENTGWVGPC